MPLLVAFCCVAIRLCLVRREIGASVQRVRVPLPCDDIELLPYRENALDDIPPTCAYTDLNIGRLLDAPGESPHAGVLWISW